MNEWKPRYSGPENSGICVCGCLWDAHHLGVVMNAEYIKQTGEGYIPEECDTYGFNEVGGMKYNKITHQWENHCHSYRDKGISSNGNPTEVGSSSTSSSDETAGG